jgi:transcriptional regulator with XRE-family HTH domain
MAIKKFGFKLKELRIKKQLTQEQLAWEADIEPMQISRIERGIINTSLSQIANLANAMQINIKDFFE